MGFELYTYHPSLGVYVSKRRMRCEEEPGALFLIREYSEDGKNRVGVVKMGIPLKKPALTCGEMELEPGTTGKFFEKCKRLDELMRAEFGETFPNLFPAQRIEYREVPEQGFPKTTVIFQEFVGDIKYLFADQVWPNFEHDEQMYAGLTVFIKFARRLFENDEIMPDVINWCNFLGVKGRGLCFVDSNPVPGKKGNSNGPYCRAIERRLDIVERVCADRTLPEGWGESFF